MPAAGAPLVFVPYLGKIHEHTACSPFRTRSVILACALPEMAIFVPVAPVVSGQLVTDSTPHLSLFCGELLGCGGEVCDGFEKDAMRAGTLWYRLTCRSFKPSCTITLNSVSDNSDGLPQFVTPKQAADRLSVCRRTIERLIAAQKLRVVKIGRATRIPVSELLRYLESATEGPMSNEGAS